MHAAYVQVIQPLERASVTGCRRADIVTVVGYRSGDGWHGKSNGVAGNVHLASLDASRRRKV
jgi:hypothetical protein